MIRSFIVNFIGIHNYHSYIKLTNFVPLATVHRCLSLLWYNYNLEPYTNEEGKILGFKVEHCFYFHMQVKSLSLAVYSFI